MKIKEIIYQHRRDFEAIYECEHCGNTVKEGGYDDANFHNIQKDFKYREGEHEVETE